MAECEVNNQTKTNKTSDTNDDPYQYFEDELPSQDPTGSWYDELLSVTTPRHLRFLYLSNVWS